MSPVLVTTRSGLRIERFSGNLYAENSYLIHDPARAAAVLVDPGTGSEALLTRLQQLSARLDFIFLTHEHYDHMAGLETIRSKTGCHVVASTACSEHLLDPKRNLSYFLEVPTCTGGPVDQTFAEPQWSVPWQGGELIGHASPGHSPGSICIALEDMVFTGDTLIAGLPTVLNLPGGDRTRLQESLQYLFTSFAGGTRLLPGHGESLLLEETRPEIHLPPLRRASSDPRAAPEFP